MTEARFRTPKMTRREMTNLIAATLAAPVLSGCVKEAFQTVSSPRRPRGIQLYTIRDMMRKAPVETIRKMVKMGYREFEFFADGYYDIPPASWKTILNDMGAKSPSRMIRLHHIRDNLEQTFDEAQAAGQEFVVLAYLTQDERKTLDQYKSYAELFCHVGEYAMRRNMRFGYHNHRFEFDALNDVIPYDYLLENVSANLMTMTMDLYHFVRAGQDPIAYINAHPGRFTQCHIKDVGSDGQTMVPVGTGIVDFPAIFALRERAGFEHFYVEHDSQDDPMQIANTAMEYLNQIEF